MEWHGERWLAYGDVVANNDHFHVDMWEQVMMQ